MAEGQSDNLNEMLDNFKAHALEIKQADSLSVFKAIIVNDVKNRLLYGKTEEEEAQSLANLAEDVMSCETTQELASAISQLPRQFQESTLCGALQFDHNVLSLRDDQEDISKEFASLFSQNLLGDYIADLSIRAEGTRGLLTGAIVGAFEEKMVNTKFTEDPSLKAVSKYIANNETLQTDIQHFLDDSENWSADFFEEEYNESTQVNRRSPRMQKETAEFLTCAVRQAFPKEGFKSRPSPTTNSKPSVLGGMAP